MPVVVRDFEVISEGAPESAAQPQPAAQKDETVLRDLEQLLKQQRAREKRARAY